MKLIKHSNSVLVQAVPIVFLLFIPCVSKCCPFPCHLRFPTPLSLSFYFFSSLATYLFICLVTFQILVAPDYSVSSQCILGVCNQIWQLGVSQPGSPQHYSYSLSLDGQRAGYQVCVTPPH